MTRRQLIVPLVVLAASAAALVVSAPPALAACHHFSVAASPNPVSEGQTVTVTVSRDGTVGPSNVDVSTVDETAKAGDDYTALKQTVSFTTNQSQTYPVLTDTHSTARPDRTFKLHLSNPGGCSVNTNFVLDPDVTVTIAANGAPAGPATTGTTAAPTTASTAASSTTAGAQATTTVTTATTATTAKPASTAPTPSVTIPFVSSIPAPSTVTAAAGPKTPSTGDDDDSVPAATAVIGVLALVAAAAVTAVVALRPQARLHERNP